MRASQQREARIDERIRELDMQLRLHSHSGDLATILQQQQQQQVKILRSLLYSLFIC